MRTTRWAAVLCVALAQAAVADGPNGSNGLEDLAAPGPCAEEPATLRGEPEGLDPLVFDVAGGPREHFDAVDVGAPGDDTGGFVPPDAPTVVRGPCEGPAAGCADVFGPRGNGVVVSEPGPGAGGGLLFGDRE